MLHTLDLFGSSIMCILCSVFISALVMMYTSEHATETLMQQLFFSCAASIAGALQQGDGRQQVITACQSSHDADLMRTSR